MTEQERAYLRDAVERAINSTWPTTLKPLVLIDAVELVLEQQED